MKKVLIGLGIAIVLVVVGAMSWYLFSLTSVSKDNKEVSFTVASGTSTKKIISDLYDAGLIKSKLASLVYAKLNKVTIQASTYTLNPSMSTKEIFASLKYGNKKENTLRLTFVEGMRLSDYLEVIAEAYDWQVEDLVKEINDKAFLQELIAEFSFLDESILNDKLYYGLEGYLYPDTYEFYKDATFKDIIKKMLKGLETQLNSLNLGGEYSLHEILTMASIVEKEAIKGEDRAKVAQVIYTRLARNMNLGMDVTAYYGVKKSMKETLTTQDLENVNPYNTRLLSFIGLPVGPICSPSLESIKAVLNPADTAYIYFYADTDTGNVYFTDSYNEFLTFKEIYG